MDSRPYGGAGAGAVRLHDRPFDFARSVSYAAAHFAAYPLATIPGAIFSVWHNFTGALAANVLKRGAGYYDEKWV